MRDLLSGLETSGLEPDPVRRMQIQMRTTQPKRFYKDVSVARLDQGFSVHLDGRPVRTPGSVVLILPTEAAASLAADEFAAQADTIQPATMPVLRLANTAVDGVARDVQAVLGDVARFAASDLVCYRAAGPQGLVDRQAALWDPVLDWAKDRLGVRFLLAEGVMPVAQPQRALEAVAAHLAGRAEPFRATALHLMTSLMGSALLALAAEAGGLDPETAWTAAHVDEDWNVERWGQDAEAAARRTARKRDFSAAVRLLEALAEP